MSYLNNGNKFFKQTTLESIEKMSKKQLVKTIVSALKIQSGEVDKICKYFGITERQLSFELHREDWERSAYFFFANKDVAKDFLAEAEDMSDDIKSKAMEAAYICKNKVTILRTN